MDFTILIVAEDDLLCIQIHIPILNIADRIIVIADGEIRKSGTKDEIMPSVLGTGAPCSVLTENI